MSTSAEVNTPSNEETTIEVAVPTPGLPTDKAAAPKREADVLRAKLRNLSKNAPAKASTTAKSSETGGSTSTEKPSVEKADAQMKSGSKPASEKPTDNKSAEIAKVHDAPKAPEASKPRKVDRTHLKVIATAVKNSRIMVVDDEKANVLTVCHHLKKDGYERFITTTNPAETLDLMKQGKPDTVLLDIKMPKVSGIDILNAKRLDPELCHIPTIILTATADPAVKRKALDLGASDFLTKPVDPNDLIPRVRNSLIFKAHLDQMASQAAQLESLVNRRTTELLQSRQQLILSLARAAEHRDTDTSNHVIRVGHYAAICAREMGWNDEQADMLEQAAQLHDVGKIGIPDSILFKPGKLDPDEYDLMTKHCALGREIIEPLSEKDFQILKSHARLGENILHIRSSPMLMMAARIAQTHHERWDGTGYPLGLAGEDIPIEGRITAVADVYDALSSSRPYKKAFPREKCFRILEEGRGTHFDPTVLNAFFTRAQDIIQVQLDFMDS